MTQIAELNDRLRTRDAAEPIIANDLDLTGVTVLSGDITGYANLPAEAILQHLSYDGPPEFPYIHAQFRPDPNAVGAVTVDLHTHALRELSRRLRVREVWGVGTAEDVRQDRRDP